MGNSLFNTGQGPPGESVETQDNGSSLSTATKRYNFTGNAVVLTEPVTDEFEVAINATVFPTICYPADSLDSPVNADWAVNALAPASPDTNNAALTVRRFDDTVEEGVGFLLNIPASATNLIIRLKSRAEAGAAANVVPQLYNRDIPDNGAVTAWSAGTALTAIAMTANENFQYDEQTITLATLGATAGELVQFELTRDTGAGGDTLAGDWDLLQLEVTFS